MTNRPETTVSDPLYVERTLRAGSNIRHYRIQDVAMRGLPMSRPDLGDMLVAHAVAYDSRDPFDEANRALLGSLLNAQVDILSGELPLPRANASQLLDIGQTTLRHGEFQIAHGVQAALEQPGVGRHGQRAQRKLATSLELALTTKRGMTFRDLKA